MGALFVVLAALFVLTGTAQAQTPGVDYVPGEVLVILKPGNAAARVAAEQTLLRTPGVAAATASRYGRVVRLSVTPGQEAAVIADLRASGAVATASLNHILYAQETPDDPHYNLQWALPKIDAPGAWDLITGTQAVTVAIIDSGLDMTHPEFSGRIVDPWDEIDDDNDPEDTCTHGTHVTGIAGATGNNATGIAGMAWGVNLMPVRVLTLNLSGNCAGTEGNIADGIHYAVAHGAQVINLSLGALPPFGYSCEDALVFPVMSQAVSDAYAAGRLVVAASGNQYQSRLACPALQAEALAVGATTSADTRAVFSNYGDGLDLMAPGESILSTVPADYGYKSGTSMATPHVSGLAALLWSRVPELTRDQVRSILESTAVDLGDTGWDPQFGYGRIDAARAVASLGSNLVVGGSATPNPVFAGQPLTYTLWLTNTGPLTATGIVLTQAVPGGLAVTSVSPGCQDNAGVVTCTLDSLAPAGSSAFETGASALETTSGILSSVITATAAPPENPDGNTTTVAVTVVTNSVTETLWLGLTTTPAAPLTQQPLTYTLIAANMSCEAGAEAFNAVLTDSLPAAVRFGRATAAPGVVCTHTGATNGGLVVCQLGTLGTCTQTTSTAVVQLVVTPTLTGPATNTACLGSLRAGPQAACVTGTVAITETAVESLWLAQTAAPAAPRVGQPVTYTLTAANQACTVGAQAQDTVLTDSLPVGVQFVEALAGPGVTCSHLGALGGGMLVCQLGTLGTCGQSTATATVQLVVAPTALGPIDNTACLGSLRAGPDAVCVTGRLVVQTRAYLPVIYRDTSSDDVVTQP